MCGKICKSKGGLTRHNNAKHEKDVNDTGQIDENDFTCDDYCKLVNKSAKSLSEDECYPESIRKLFETYAFSVNLAVKEQFSKINTLYTSLRKGKVEKFYSKYFALVPSQAFEYFPGLSAQLSVLLATRVADKIVTFSKHRDFSTTSVVGFSHLPSFCCINARSLLPKIDELTLFLSCCQPSVVAVTESWLNIDIEDGLVSINGYNIFRKDRPSRRGGGVWVYLPHGTYVKRRLDLEHENLECLWLWLRPTRLPRPLSGIAVCIVYHPLGLPFTLG